VDVKKPYLLCAAGILTGLANTPLVMANITLFHLAPAAGPVAIAHFLEGIIASPVIRDAVSECLIEIADKTISLVLAAVIALLLSDILAKEHPDRSE